jgi:hypothetical protein
MAKDQIDDLEQKKQELEAELHQIQQELDNSLDQVRYDVSRSFDPKAIIRKYPLPIVGASAFIGFFIGHDGKSSKGVYGQAILSELKKLVTKRAISFATDYVENLLEEKADEHLDATNGTAKE